MASYVTMDLEYTNQPTFMQLDNKGVPEAPLDGYQYVRKNAAWYKVDFDEIDTKLDTEIEDRIEGDINLGLRVDHLDSSLTEELGRIESESMVRDDVLQSKIYSENSARIAADLVLENSKEDAINYGEVGQLASVNDTQDGFEFIEQPDLDFKKVRGELGPYKGSEPLGIANVSGDALNEVIYAGSPPRDRGNQPNKVTYRLAEDITTVIHPGGPELGMLVGDELCWQEDGSMWVHLDMQSRDCVTDLNSLSGGVVLAGNDGLNISVNLVDNAITFSADASVIRDTGAQIIGGTKTFTSTPVSSGAQGTGDNHLAKISHTRNAGNLTEGTIPSARIANNAITNARIADQAVNNTKIANGANISGGKLADKTITNAKLVDKTLTSVQISDNTITNSNIANNAAIAGSKLQAATATVAGAVTTGSQVIAGAKTFTSAPVCAVNPSHDDHLLRRGWANSNFIGLSSNQTISGAKNV